MSCVGNKSQMKAGTLSRLFHLCLFFYIVVVFVDRMEGLHEVKDNMKPFDWTYSTDYKGTLSTVTSATMEVIWSHDLSRIMFYLMFIFSSVKLRRE